MTLSAVIFPDSGTGVWIVQGLEYDICVQAETLEAVQTVFETTLNATALASMELGRKPFEGIDPAPKKFWEMFNRAAKSLPLRRPRFVAVAGAPPVKIVERIAA